tara:strand:- start:602 stop:1117 length:516 start_codon:yes stop_codon:yes gene_type:complete
MVKKPRGKAKTKPRTKAPAKPKAKVGRKPKLLTEEMQDKFLKAVRLGCPVKDSCGCAGFSDGWFYEQSKKAKEQPGLATSKEFTVFLRRIKEVEGEATNRWLAMVEKAAMSGTWQAAAWKLERRRGMTLKVQQEISGPDGGPIKHEAADAKDRLLDKLASLHEQLSEAESD